MRQCYHTDLTNAQWQNLRATVFNRVDHGANLREVINALLYRERSGCPWRLLPPGFPPTDQLRAAWGDWQANGIWERVRKRIGVPSRPRSSSPVTTLGRLRRAIATGFRAIPGGTASLWPGRKLIQLFEWTASRFTIHAKLPGWFREGHRLMVAEEYEAATEYFTRILEIDPINVPTRMRRAYANLQLGRHQDVCSDCWIACALPDVTLDAVLQAHYILSESHTLLGDLDKAVEHGYMARLIAGQGSDPAWGTLDAWEDRGLVPGPDEFELLANTHNGLAEYAINKASNFAIATALYLRGDEYRARYARWLEDLPDRTLFLSEDWVRNIGHMALIDFWVKMDRMGWRSWDRMVLIAPPASTANLVYAEYYSRHFRMIRTAQVPAGIRHMTVTFGPRVASLISYPDGSTRYFTEGMGLIQEAWEREGREPLLQLTPSDIEFGRRQLRAMGVPKGAWFVSLHARSPGFHREGKVVHQAHRNATIASYLPAVREIVRRGGFVIRMGDPSMEPFPPTPGVIDYARGRLKSPRMDVFLCGGCRFFIGGASGISHIPTTFGLPCVLTNWLSNALPVYSKNDLFVPKMLRSIEDGRMLTFDEYLARDTRLLSYSGEKLADSGFEVVDNTPDELRDVVTEMMDRLDGTASYTSADEELVGTFDALARGHGLAGFSRIGLGFLTDHAVLLPGHVPSKAA